MTQEQLADRVGVDKTAVSHWERGTSAPRWHREALVAAALDCTVRELRGESMA